MRRKAADYYTGGAPNRIQLQSEHCTPIFTAYNLAQLAKPTADSEELAAILQSGWATHKETYDKKHELILKLACVNYRIMAALDDGNPKAKEIHLSYLRKLTGEAEYKPEQARALYEINKFTSFEKQARWFNDTNSVEHFKYINGAILKTWTRRSGYFKKPPPTLEQVLYDDKVYTELGQRKADLAARRAQLAQS